MSQSKLPPLHEGPLGWPVSDWVLCRRTLTTPDSTKHDQTSICRLEQLDGYEQPIWVEKGSERWRRTDIVEWKPIPDWT